MSQGVTTAKAANDQASFQLMASLLNILDQAVFVSDRSGRVLFANLQGQDLVNDQDTRPKPRIESVPKTFYISMLTVFLDSSRGANRKSIFRSNRRTARAELEFVGFRNRIGLSLLWSQPSLKVLRMKPRCARRSRN